MQMNEILSRWSRSLAMGIVVLALTACQPIRPIQETGTEGAANEAATPTAQPEATADEATPTEAPSADTAASQPASGDAQKAAELVAKGQELLKISDLRAAEQNFQNALAADPSSLDAQIGLADVYIYMPEYHQQALDAAQAAVDMAPESPEALARLSWAQSGIHKFEKAKATAEKAVELGPDSSVAHAALADILYAMYEIDAAHDAAQRAVTLDSSDAGAWATLGSVVYGMENWDEAGNDYQKALDLEPDFFLWQILNARYVLDS